MSIMTASLVLLVATLAFGLEPEWTICLPDSLSGLPGPQCAAYNPLTDKVYVGGSGNCVLVIDCATNKKVARIPTKSGASAVFCSPANGRLYCAGDVMTVIDCLGDPVVRTLPVNQAALCYNSRSQELYAYAGRGGQRTIVMDTRTDSIVDTLELGAGSVCYNPEDDKIYCRTGDKVKVFHGRDRAFITDVPVGGGAGSLCYNPASNKVYCANYGSRTVTVIDGSTNAALASIVADPGFKDICCNPSNNKIYLANGARGQRYDDRGGPLPEIGDSTVSVIDGATDKIIATVRTHGRPTMLSYDSASNKVLAACEDSRLQGSYEDLVKYDLWSDIKRKPTVDIIDGRTNQLVSSTPLSYQVAAFCLNPGRGRVYCVVPDRDQPDIVTLAVGSGKMIAKVPTARRPGILCYNPRDNKLYCSIRRDGDLVVLDGATDRFLSTVKIGREPWRMCYNSKEDKVYCDPEYMTKCLVLDGKTDSVTSSLMIGSPVWYDSLNNWVYSFNEPWATGRVAVTDGTTDSIIAEVPFRQPSSFCGNPKADKVYCHSDQTGELAIIEGATHALVTTIPIGVGEHVLCCDYRNNKVYCAQDTMKVINGTTNAVDTTWFMPADAMCYNERNNKLYVGGRHGLFVIDATTRKVMASFSEYKEIRIAYYNAGDNRVYCVNWSNVVVVDGASNQVLRTYAVPTGWHFLACNTKENIIYVANQDGYGISVIRGGSP